jgi:spermidine synthase
MSEPAVLSSSAGQHESRGGRSLLTGIFVMSLASLLLELSLTRLFSVILFYHFAFLAVSVALLGLGAGGVFAYVRREWLARWPARTLGSAVAALNAVAVVLVLEIVLHVPVSLELSRTSFIRLTVIYLASAVPFFLTGLMFSVIFARETQRIGSLYGADLAGGSAACLALVPLLNLLGGPNTVLVAGLGMALASLIWADAYASRRRAVAMIAVVIVLVAVNYSGKLIDIVYAKGMRRTGDWVLFARWNAISRVEVDQQGPARVIVIDADASTYIMNVDPHRWAGTDWQRNLMSDVPSVANVLRPHGDYAIIGPGGGVDVLRAVANGSSNVTSIEINPLIATTIMRGRYADYAYHLYEIPEVHMHVSDGRSWIRNSKQRFDVLQMTLVDTWASTAAGAFALSENSLYTVDAFREYFQHLKPDGMVCITRWEFSRPREALRLVAVAMEALHQLGIRDASHHFMVVANKVLNVDGVPVAVVAKKSPFTSEEEAAVIEHLRDSGKLTPLYLPSMRLDNPFGALIARNDPHVFAREYEFNVAPVDDNAPFFFFTIKPAQILKAAVTEGGIDWKVNVGVAVLLMLLVISAIAVLAFLILPLALIKGARHEIKPLYYFIAIGLGYILVEIAFIQRFVLFLGHPTYAITVVVFLMLLASGAGSMVSRRWLSHPLSVRVPLALIVVAILLYVFALPLLLTELVGLSFAVKLLLSSAVLVPLGFLMGMPFPSGLRALHGAGGTTIEWAWAMNAAASVLGSVLAMVIAIQFGLTVTLVCGAVGYTLAIVLTATFKRQAA